jgi:transcriptional regulator with XRE-family HTH domain
MAMTKGCPDPAQNEKLPEGRTPREALALAIRTARQRAGLSQQQLAAAADLSLRTIEDTEENRTEPKWGTLRRIAKGIAIPLGVLLEEAEQLE